MSRIPLHDHSDQNSGGRIRQAAPIVQSPASVVSVIGGTPVDNHINDASDAHDASAISIADAGSYFTGTDVEAALQELGSGGGGVSLSSATPLVESGAGSAGTATDASRSDHVHPAGGGGGGLAWETDVALVEARASASTGGTFTVTMTTTLQAGDILIVASGGGGVQSTPSATNITFTNLGNVGGATAARVDLWKGVCSASPGQTITFTRASGSAAHWGCAALMTGLTPTVGASATQTGSGLIAVTGAVLANDGEVLFGACTGATGSVTAGVSPLFETLAGGSNFYFFGWRRTLAAERIGLIAMPGSSGAWAAITMAIS